MRLVRFYKKVFDIRAKRLLQSVICTASHLNNNDSFCGDVVLDSLNMEYRDKDSILDQMYQKQIFMDFYYEDLEFYE